LAIPASAPARPKGEGHPASRAAYGLTTGSGIVEALVRVKARVVDVRLIADKTTPCGRARRFDGSRPMRSHPHWLLVRLLIFHRTARPLPIFSTLCLRNISLSCSVTRRTKSVRVTGSFSESCPRRAALIALPSRETGLLHRSERRIRRSVGLFRNATAAGIAAPPVTKGYITKSQNGR
jgi:hypothetical protein